MSARHDYTLEVQRHAERILGPVTKGAHFRQAGDSTGIDVLKWDAEVNPQGVFIYLSAGASKFPLPSSDLSHRIEVYIGVLPDAPVGELVASVAIHAAVTGAEIGTTHTITFSEDTLWPGTNMNSVLLRNPSMHGYEAVFPYHETNDGIHIEFLQLIPLHASELSFKRKWGYEQLWAVFERQQTPVWDPNRPAARFPT